MKNLYVIHRGDRTLQKSAEKDPQDFKGTAMGDIIIPMRKVILQFVDKYLVNIENEFSNREGLREVLKKWPEFAAKKIEDTKLVIAAMRDQDEYIICSDGVNQLLVVGIIMYS